MKNRKKQKVRVRSKFKKLKKEKIKQISKHSLSLIVASLIGGIILLKIYHFLFFSSSFQLKQIEINGNIALPESRIKESLKLGGKENIFLLTKEKISENLEEIPVIKRVVFKRKIPDTLCLGIIERSPLGHCKIKGQLKGIDEEGIIFDCNNLKKDVPFISGLNLDKERTKKGQVLEFLQLKEKCNCKITDEIVEITPLNSCKIMLLLKDGTKVFFGKVTSQDIKSKLNCLEKVFADLKRKGQKVNYVNMQYFTKDMGKVIVKLNKEKRSISN